ncbi:MAG: pyridoxal phosphate-dependent aminotransferase [Candidatus Melainabacteria bacterium]|nr:pyridoxal phosphate-dependent aminotransferase [Candidatus Melainabacteria bacterium]
MESLQDLLSRIGWCSSNAGSPSISDRAMLIRESNIRDAARLVEELSRQAKIINLGQGLPEYPAPQVLKDAAKAAIDADFNQYSNTWGYLALRQAIARKLAQYNGIVANPDTEITVTCGVSEGLNATLLATVNPGDEVIIVEPFYENYHANVIMAGGTPRYVRLHEPDWTFDERELKGAFNRHTRAILINTPHNPTGRVMTCHELQLIGSLCQKWGVLAVCDEMYEYMVYDGHQHISLASLPGMEDRTVTLSGLSKTFSVTGWRLGYLAAPEPLSKAIRHVHDYLTLAAPSPLQQAAVVALDLPADFYKGMSTKYQGLRDKLMTVVSDAGFTLRKPEGTYYLFTDCSHMGLNNDRQCWEYLLRQFGLATVAGYCFYRPGTTTQRIRFCCAKYPETIDAAAERLKELKVRITGGAPVRLS